MFQTLLPAFWSAVRKSVLYTGRSKHGRWRVSPGAETGFHFLRSGYTVVLARSWLFNSPLDSMGQQILPVSFPFWDGFLSLSIFFTVISNVTVNILINSSCFHALFYQNEFLKVELLSVQFSCSVVSFCDPMNRSTPGLPVHHQLPEFTQTHVHWVSDAIQPSHPLSSPSPPAFNLS